MIGGTWARGGRADNESYSLEIGHMLRFHVSLNPRVDTGGLPWRASLNTMTLGEFATFEEAIEGVKSEARQHMARTLEDWERFLVEPDPNRRRGRRR